MSQIFINQPWDPKAKMEADLILKEIHQLVPELEVLFMGAVALGVSGKNDIDLDILCESKDLKKYTAELEVLFGSPKEITKILAAWSFFRNGIEMDVILSDPRYSHVPEQKSNFEILKNNSVLLEEYRRLKEQCTGLSYDVYNLKKKEFFSQRLAKLKTQQV